MYSNICYLLSFLLLFFKFKNCEFTNIFSYVEKNWTSDNYNIVSTNVEKTYLQSVSHNVTRKDIVCTLEIEKKLDLCRIVFEIPFYKYKTDTYLNKIPFFKAKLLCITAETTLRYNHPDSHSNIKISQDMYPCFGRHEIVQTSFIEDDYYEKFYLSVGPENNSVTVYVRAKYGKYKDQVHVYDFIHNIDFSKLGSKFVSEKDIVTELKLNKKLFVVNNSTIINNTYAEAQQDHSENDPICDIPYEKKVALCKLVLDYETYKNVFLLTLNKAANTILNLNCITRPVYSSTEKDSIQLQYKQKMYPCHGRHQLLSETNVLIDPYVNKLFLSSGPTRNSIFVYLRTETNNNLERYVAIKMMQNINIASLKSANITLQEVKEESAVTFVHVKKIIELNIKNHWKQLVKIINETKPEEVEKENEKINQLLKNDDHDYYSTLEKIKEMKRAKIQEMVAIHRGEKLSKSTESVPLFKKEKNIQKLFSDNTEQNEDNIRVGSQILRIALHRMREQMESITNISLSQFKLSTLYQPTVEIKYKNVTLNNEVQKLIKNMEMIVMENHLQKIRNSDSKISTVRIKNIKDSKKDTKITGKKKRKP